MAVTDLTGTKWIINEIPNIPSSTNYALDFTSNGGEYNGFVFAYNGIMFRGDTLTPVYMPFDQGWYSDNFRTIEITGGTDATNSDLISWLQANATQITEPSNPISIGNLPIANMYFGTRRVIKAYFGNSLVWERETPVPENALLAQDGKLFANGGGYLITTEVTMITFTFSGTTYQAEEGMTWGEWVASEYNTDGFTQRGYGIYGPGGEEIKDPQHMTILESAKIVANTAYISGGSND